MVAPHLDIDARSNRRPGLIEAKCYPFHSARIETVQIGEDSQRAGRAKSDNWMVPADRRGMHEQRENPIMKSPLGRMSAIEERPANVSVPVVIRIS